MKEEARRDVDRGQDEKEQTEVVWTCYKEKEIGICRNGFGNEHWRKKRYDTKKEWLDAIE